MSHIRPKYTWDAHVITKDGQAAVEKVQAYWSPNFELTTESVAHAATAQLKAQGIEAGVTAVNLAA